MSLFDDEVVLGATGIPSPRASLFDAPPPSPDAFRLKNSMQQGSTLNPKVEARIVNLQAKTGLPADMLRQDIDTYEKLANSANFNAEEFRAKSPAVAEWMSKNASHAAIAKDDMANLGVIEGYTRSITRGFEIGQKQQEAGRLGYDATMDKLTPGQYARMTELDRDVSRTLGGTNLLQEMLHGSAKILGQWTSSASQSKSMAAAGMISGAAATGGNPVGAMTGGGVGLAAGMMIDAYKSMAGQFWLDTSKMRDETGMLQIDEGVRKGAAHAVGFISSGLEMAGLGMVTAPVKKAVQAAMFDQAKLALSRPTAAAAAAEFGKAYAVALGGETGTEILQEVVSIVGEEMSKAASVGNYRMLLSDQDLQAQTWDRIVNVATETIKGMALLGLPGPAMAYRSDMMAVDRAEKRVEYYKALGTSIADSETYKNLPDAVKQIVAGVTAGGPIKDMYVSPEFWNSYWQEKGVDPDAIATEVFGSNVPLREAMEAGHDIKIPLDDYATKIAPTEHNEAFSAEIRRQPGELNGREANALKSEIDAAVSKIAEQEKEAESALGKVSAVIRDALTKIGFSPKEAQSSADQMGAFFTTMAERSGKPVQELLAKYKPNITRSMKDTDGTLLEQPVWHGSRARGIQKFQNKFVNTGEKAQAYGWGLYFTEKKGIAEWYRDKLSDADETIIINGEDAWFSDYLLAKIMSSSVEDHVGTDAFNAAKAKGPENVARFLAAYLSRPRVAEGYGIDENLEVMETLRGIASGTIPASFDRKSAGMLYSVEIPDTGYLDWDKQYSDQSPEVQKAFEEAAGPLEEMVDELYADRLRKAIVTYLNAVDAVVPRQGLHIATGSDGFFDGPDVLDSTGELVSSFMEEDRAKRLIELAESGYLTAVIEKLKEEIKYQDMEVLWSKAQSVQEQFGSIQGVERYDGTDLDEVIDLTEAYLTQKEKARANQSAARVRKGGGRSMYNHLAELINLAYDTVRAEGEAHHLLNEALRESEGAAGARWDAVASLYLRKMGIPGITYIGDDSGARNYVVFDEDRIQITGFEQRDNPFRKSKVQEVVYHGTSADIGKFDTERIGQSTEQSGIGIYFSNKPEIASAYAEWTHEAINEAVDEAIRDGEREEDFVRGAANVIPAHINITRPLLVDLSLPEWERYRNDPVNFIDDHMGDMSVDETSPLYFDYDKYDGIIILGNGKDPDGENVYVVPNPSKQVKSAISGDLMQKSGTEDFGPRGRITFGPDKKFTIELTENANLSTFLHESGHMYLEIFEDLTKDLEVPQQIRDDYEAMLRWAGVKPPEGITAINHWQKMSVEERRPHHENFARGMEAYFMEGRAPSVALQSAFSRFRRWLISIYRQLTELGGIRLNDEIRGVMDRMLATDAEIADAEKAAEVKKMFLDAMTAGMDPKEFSLYEKTIEAASIKAQEELQTKLVKQLTRQRARWWKNELDQTRKEVSDELDQMPEYIAISLLTTGKMPDGTLQNGADFGKINLLDAEQRYLASDPELLDKLESMGVLDGEGFSADSLAAALGFQSGDAMMKAVAFAPERDQWIEEEANTRMRNRHGDMLLDGSVQEEAAIAVMNEKRSEVLHMELRALNAMRRKVDPHVKAERSSVRAEKMTGMRLIRESVPKINDIRRIAQDRISQMIVSEINPELFYVAARNNGKQAIKALASGDYQTAAVAKQRELLNTELYRAANQAKTEIDGITEYVRSFRSPGMQKSISKAGESYVQQISAIIDRYDFAKVSAKELQRRQSLMAWVQQREAENLSVDIPEDILDESRRQNYKTMTLDEIRSIRDTIKQIAHLARLKNKLLNQRDKRTLQVIAESVSDAVMSSRNKTVKADIESRTPVSDAVRAVGGFLASHRKLASYVREMDSFKDNGVLWNLIVRPLNEAATAEALKTEESVRKLKEIFSAYSIGEVSKMYMKEQIAGTNISLSRSGRLAVALNWGNEDSRIKLMDGHGWSQVQVQAILDTLDERDWKVVQSVWDHINSFWPEIEAKQKRVFGVAPDKVKAATVMTKFGELEGGYYPIKYDPRLSPRAYSDRVKDIAEMMMRGAFSRSTTKRGHTVARVTGVQMPIRLDLGVISEHISQVVHDLTHHEYLVDTNRIIGNEKVQTAIINRYGDLVYQQFQDILRDVAAGNIPAETAVERSLNWVRNGTTIAAMGYNLMTALMQPLGLAQSSVVVGPVYMAKAFSRLFGDAARMENTVKWIVSKSDFMKTRGHTQVREIAEIRNSLRITGKLSAVENSYFWLIAKAQMMADVPTWLAQYEKSMDAGVTEETAIAQADQAVLQSQGGGQIKDLAQVQRGSPAMKLWTNFYSYFNVTYNLTAETLNRTKVTDPLSVGKAAVDLLLLYAFPATATTILKHALKSDDDEDKLMEKIIRENISYMLGMMVIMRELSGVASGFYGYEGPAGTKVFAEFGKIARGFKDGELTDRAWKSVNTAAGILFHYPAGQVQRMVEGYTKMQDDRSMNPTPMLFGVPK